jgi:predicted nucleotidyltransferase
MEEDRVDRKRTIAQDKLDLVIRRVVEVAKPEKIILFGSAARGAMGPNSDVDLLVIKRGEFHRGRLTEEIYMNLFGVGAAVDVVVVTPEDLERYRDSFALVIYPAMREGKVVYVG